MISTLDDSGPGVVSGGSPAEDSHEAVLSGSVDRVREILAGEVGADQVGAAAEQVPESPGVATQYYACTHPGYPGWRWAVTITHAEGADDVTVDDIVLLPGGRAIVAPAWVPYRERIQSGDLSPGDILPTDEDDVRLVPTYFDGEDGPGEQDDVRGLKLVADELGLGRTRVLSLEGREIAADRWYAGDPGPDSPLAQQAHHQCRSCGFLVRLAGPLSVTFGVCANEFANDDAKVVALGHGCGAHSDAQLRKKQLPVPVPDPFIDEMKRDDLENF